MLGQTATPTRLVQEFLFHVRPRLHLVDELDHTATPPAQSLPEKHRLLAAYRSLALPPVDWAGRGIRHAVERDDQDTEICLVKEVHALLASEAVIRALECPTAFVARDPIATADSILRTNGRRQFYLLAESRHLSACSRPCAIAPDFGNLQEAYRRLRRMPRPTDASAALSLVFAVASLHLHFARLAREYDRVQLVQYEDLCIQPEHHFRRLAASIGVQWNARSISNLRRLNTAPSTNSPYETRRLCSRQLAKRPAVLTPQEVDVCQQLLCDGGYASIRAAA